MKMKKIKLLLFITLFLLPVAINAKTYDYVYLTTDIYNTIYEPGDTISFSNSYYCKIMMIEDYNTNSSSLEEIQGDECNSTYTVEKKSIISGLKNTNSGKAIILLSPVYENTKIYEISDLVAGRVFKSGSIITYEATHILYYNQNEELIEDLSNHSGFTNRIVPKINNQDVYWMFKGVQDVTYQGRIPILQLVDYQKPTFSIQCDKESIRSDETTTCKIIANTFNPIYELHFDLANENIDVSNVKVLNNIESIAGEKEYNLKIDETYANNNQTIELISFTIKGTKDEAYIDNITMSNISYRDSVISDDYDNVENRINIVSKESKESIIEKISNPKTGNVFLLYVMIPIILSSIAYAALTIRKKKKNI